MANVYIDELLISLLKKNITPYSYHLTVKDRMVKNGHKSLAILITGFSGSGKSTIANALENALFDSQIRSYILDGDNLRNGMNDDLGFSTEDRKENMRRIGEMAALMTDAGLVTIAPFIAPFKKERAQIKKTVGAQNYIEIYLNTSIEVCKERDVKGLYEKAERGIIKNMTGIDGAYDVPDSPDLCFDTSKLSIELIVSQIMQYLLPKLKVSNE